MRYLFLREGFTDAKVRKILQIGTFLYEKIHGLCPKTQKCLAKILEDWILYIDSEHVLKLIPLLGRDGHFNVK